MPSQDGEKQYRCSITNLLRRRKGVSRAEQNRSGLSQDASRPPSLKAPAIADDAQRSRLSGFLSPKSVFEEMPDPLLTQTFSDPEAINAFAEALKEDQGNQEPPHPHMTASASAWTKLGLPSLGSPTLSLSQGIEVAANFSDPLARSTQPISIQPQTAGSRKVGKIAAVSDFAPTRQPTSSDTGRRAGFVYALLRWPLLLAIFVVIGVEFLAYVATRQIVNLVEWSVAHRGRKGVLRRKMRKAPTFDEWTETALELDDFMDHEKWKRQDASGMYDWILVQKVLHSLKTFREQREDTELMAVLDLCCRNNFAGTENFRLYSETYYGTKYLIEEYLSEVERGFHHITHSDRITLEQKRAFFRGVSKNLGRSGLCLSGGGSFGYYHIGLVKALLDAKLLPKIVSGTSAGGLVAALTCTRTDEELCRLLVPEIADRITACEEPLRIWAKRVWKTGARFDPVQWAEKAAFFTMGSLTFKEAYERTGKTLNVSVIPSDRNSPVKLLNYLTAPRCVIWSALLASAAVPGLLPPVCLMQKTRNGDFVPWNWGHRFKDGSLRVDIPLQDLHSMFHVNYPIVSQVNPHVHLFFFAPTGNPGRPVAHRKGKGWRGGFLLSAAEHVLKLHLSVNFKIIRDLDLLPAIWGTDWSGVFLQRFGGAVTIWPKTRFWDWIRILSDPDRTELARMMRVGEKATWPKLHMIENRIRMERAVEKGRKLCRQQLRQAALYDRKAQGHHSNQQAGETRIPLDKSAETNQGNAHQDSGTDASVGFAETRAGGLATGFVSDTDGEAPGDYFRLRLGSSQTQTSKRLLGSFSGMMTPGTDANPTPSSAVARPTVLPMRLRLRPSHMDDDAEPDDHNVDEDNEVTVDAGFRASLGSSAVSGRPQGAPNSSDAQPANFGQRAEGDAAGYEAAAPDAQNSLRSDRQRHQALTAAALAPTSSRRLSASPGSGNSNSNDGGRCSSISTAGGRRRRFSYQAGGAPCHQQQYNQNHVRDWSGGRGSISLRSPWDSGNDDGRANYRDKPCSDTSSSASDTY